MTPLLTDRERAVLALLEAGCTYPEAAALLGIKARTVKAHAASLRDKLGAANNVQAVAIVVRARATV